jgi:hypothetical protein
VTTNRTCAPVTRWPVILLIVLGIPFSESPGQTDSVRHIRDTTIVVAPGGRDTVLPRVNYSDSGAFHPTKSPWLAVGLSAAVPGVGQIYDERYWKAPVIWGVGGYWVYEWIKQNDKYTEFRDRYQASLSESGGGNSRFRDLRDFYHDERDRFAWFLGGLYLLNLVDAYVGAHLYDFDVGPSLSQNDHSPAPGIRASIRFKF